MNSIPQPKNASGSLNSDFSDLELGIRKAQVKGKGKVKAILGDTIVVKGANGNEKKLVLSGVIIPRIGGKKDADEPFAYQAREFLRRTLLDQSIEFVLQEGGSGNSGREYATITFKGEDVGAMVVKAGLAKVSLPKKVEEQFEAAKTANAGKKVDLDLSALHAEKQELYKLQQQAEKQKLGMFSGAKGVRTITWEEDGAAVFAKLKGKPVRAYVERVLDGSTLRLELAGANLEHNMVAVALAGVNTPRFTKEIADGKAAYEFVESRLQGRDVELVLHAVDKTGNVYGTVSVPQGDIAVRLLETGLGSFVAWTANTAPHADKLRTAAKFKPASLSEFSGVVTQVLSGDTVVVRNQLGAEVKVSLSSVSAPRANRRDAKKGDAKAEAEPFAFEAKEMLRKAVIGAKVHVRVDYERELKKEGSTESRPFVTLSKGNTNVVTELLAAGLVEVVALPRDADRASNYGALLAEEQKAKAAGKGMWGKNTPVAPVDLSNTMKKTDRTADKGESKQQAKVTDKAAEDKLDEAIKKIQNGGVMSGVVEAVYSATKLKVYFPALHAYVPVNIASVAGSADRKSAVAEQGAALIKQYLQRDVTVESSNGKSKGIFANVQDKASKTNLAVALLEQGLATLIRASADKNKLKNELVSAETGAKKARKGLWVDYDEEKERLEADKARAEANDNLGAGVYTRDDQIFVKVRITDIVDPVHFYFTNVEDKNVDLVQQKLAAVQVADAPEGYKPSVGSLVLVRVDEQWYRARVDAVAHGVVAVQYIDYGYVGKAAVDQVRPCPEDLVKIKALARPAALTGLRAPPKDTDYETNAEAALTKMILDNVFEGRIDYTDNGVINFSLFHESDTTTSVNAHMLKLGHAAVAARVPKRLQSILEEFREFELDAQHEHKGIWEYGVIDMDSKDEQ